MPANSPKGRPSRRYPAHPPPRRLRNRPTILFLTVCVDGRRKVLARPEIHGLLVAIWKRPGPWLVGKYLLMPDHLHLFCAPACEDAPDLRNWVRFWKGHASRSWPHPREAPIWQKDCWDRQLRSSESYQQKWEYVRNNPVRAGLCRSADDWPYQGEIAQLRF
jgi:putative transposase